MSTNVGNLVVRHNDAEQRFETMVGENLAVAEYRRAGDRIIFTHTEVPEALEGHGIGHKLAHAALEYARAQQLRVVPRCRFIAGYIRSRPEYKPLVADESGKHHGAE